jgi:hypothetical protein
MFKATHKRRATTLSKTLLTAGLLGGAALSTLGAGSAQAAPFWDRVVNGYQCFFGGTGTQCTVGEATPTTVPVPLSNTSPVTPPSTSLPYTCPTYTSYPCDKLLTLLDWTSIPGSNDIPNTNPSTLEFVWLGPSDSHPWHVDVDLNGFLQDDNGGILGYTVQATDWLLTDAQLAGQLQAGSSPMVKAIYSSFAAYTADSSAISPTGDLCTLTTTGSAVTCNYGPVSQIWVRDKWFGSDVNPGGATSPTSSVDNFANDFSQTDVPAPLPLLGVGAAFGSIRKLRKFSSQLKTFSMG